MRLLILAGPFDAVAAAVGRRVQTSGGVVEQRSLEQLAAARWRHRLGCQGVATDLAFADGLNVDAMAPDMILNRLRYEPALLFTRMALADREYARAEFLALLLSWLASLGDRVIGRPAPSGLGGVRLGAWQWLTAAADAGFRTYAAAATTSARHVPATAGDATWPDLLPGADDPVLDLLGFDRPRALAPVPVGGRQLTVIGGRIVPDDDPVSSDGALSDSARRLADQCSADILLIDLAQVGRDPRWRFVTATTMPEKLGEPAIDALAAMIGAPR